MVESGTKHCLVQLFRTLAVVEATPALMREEPDSAGGRQASPLPTMKGPIHTFHCGLLCCCLVFYKTGRIRDTGNCFQCI